MTSVDRILLLVLHALLLQRIASQTPPSSNSSGEDFNFQITVAMNNDTKQEAQEDQQVAQEDQQVAQKSTDIPMQLLDDTESYGRYADELVNCTDFLPIEQIASGYDNCSQVIDSLATFQNLGLNFSLCDSEVVWRQGYCQKTCGLCLDCEDTPYPEINLECNSVKAVGLCREMEIYQDATYCGRSCNTCEVLAKRQGGFGCSNAKTIQCDVDALLLFKSMMSENAQKELSSWVGDDPCSWQGVSCNYGNQRVTKLQLGEYVRINKTERTQDDSRTVKSNAVQKFEKRNNNAFGGQMYAQLPPQISQMMYLEVLQLSGNEISGTLPPELSMLTNLQHLILFDNKFNGTIPSVWLFLLAL
eukprot:TRINITY_DN2815_c0_g4_i4.p1 TRINITY_DN2815_c0_g4~~TRINITY_DN2815_c0_g4_i4.p1  ORF type:complete len:359 (-),score=41.92 TRINITY_DN2815_c0_g4_i4:7-1083(-)